MLLSRQVLKDLYALDDGGASLAAGKDLGSGLARTGLVHLLLSLLAALPPIQARTRSSSDAPSMPPPDALRRIRELPVVESVREAAAALPKCPPYLGYRTDIVAGVHAPPPFALQCRLAWWAHMVLLGAQNL